MEAKPLGILATVGMLVASNLFMTFAWYWHLKLQKPGASSWPLIAIVIQPVKIGCRDLFWQGILLQCEVRQRLHSNTEQKERKDYQGKHRRNDDSKTSSPAQ